MANDGIVVIHRKRRTVPQPSRSSGQPRASLRERRQQLLRELESTARAPKTTISTQVKLALLYALVCSAADSGSGYECPIDGLRAVDFVRDQVRTDQIETSDLITIWGDMHRRLRPRSSQRWFEDVLERMADAMQKWVGGQAGASVGMNVGFQLQRIRRSGTGQVSELMKEVLVTLQGQLPR